MPLDKTSANAEWPPLIFGLKHDTNEVKGENKPADDNGYRHVFVTGNGHCDTGHYTLNIKLPCDNAPILLRQETSLVLPWSRQITIFKPQPIT